MSSLPGSLSDQYEIVDRYSSDPDKGSSYRVCDAGQNQFFLKLSQPRDSANYSAAWELRELVNERASQCESIQPLHDSGYADNEWFYELSRFETAGNLADLIEDEGALDEADFLTLIRDLAAAISSLQEEDGNGRRIVHGDIKPANVLVCRDSTGRRSFRLSDFSGSVVLRHGVSEIVPHYSEGYASPQLLHYAKSPEEIPLHDWRKMDYWSLGILALEACTGRFPFEGLEASEIRNLMINWKPSSYKQIPDDVDRALISGLLRRQSARRWQDAEIQRWLRVKKRQGAEDDYGFVTTTLATHRRECGEQPFSLGGREVLSLNELATYLLNDWDIEALTTPALSDWLDVHFPAAAGLLQDILGNPNYSDDVRLLRFSYPHLDNLASDSAHTVIDPIWRKVVITEESLRDTARKARDGDAACTEWLTSLFRSGRPISDHGGVAYLLQSRLFAIADLLNRIETSRASYEEAWSAIVAAGAPAELQPDETQSVIDMVSLAVDSEFVAQLKRQRTELFDVRLLLRRAPWFLAFGTGRKVSAAETLVLRNVNRSSIKGETVIERLVDMPTLDLEEIKEEILVPRSQVDLLNGLVARPGAQVLELRPGDVFSDVQKSGLAYWWSNRRDRFCDLFSRSARWIRGLFGTTAAELSLEIRAAPMVAHEDAHQMYTSYLVLASWDVRPSCATSLIVRNDDGFNRMAKLKIRDLGASGAIQLLLTNDSRIELQAKDRWWRQPQRTESIVLRFRRRPVLRRLETELRRCQAGVRATPELCHAES